MLRALIITSIYPGPDDWQMGIFIHRQVLNLVRQGVECRVLCFHPAPPPFPRWLVRRTWLRHRWKYAFWNGQVDGVTVDWVYYPRQWTRDEDVVPNIAAALVRHIEERPELQQTDVLYAHFLWTAGAAALALRERFGWPVAAIARGSEMHNWHKHHVHCRDYVVKVLREADAPLANCQDLRDRAEVLAPGAAARMQVIYNGCDATLFRPATDKRAVRRTLNLDENSRLLLFCGSLEERKGIPELTTAWREFSVSHPEWQLIAVGGATQQHLAEKLRAEGNGRVVLTGQVAQDKVIAYLQAADAYVQPSRLEGLANATMEAAAIGLPIITTDTCGQREVIQNEANGWLVPPQDPTALLRALEKMSDDPARAAQMGHAARATIERDFNPSHEARKLAGLLQDLRAQGSAVEIAASRC